MFEELNRSGQVVDGTGDTERSPVLLLLGGGMAAGKSTVREIIGHHEFWTKVPFKSHRLWGTGFGTMIEPADVTLAHLCSRTASTAIVNYA